jgi:hypothetical protein
VVSKNPDELIELKIGLTNKVFKVSVEANKVKAIELADCKVSLAIMA